MTKINYQGWADTRLANVEHSDTYVSLSIDCFDPGHDDQFRNCLLKAQEARDLAHALLDHADALDALEAENM